MPFSEFQPQSRVMDLCYGRGSWVCVDNPGNFWVTIMYLIICFPKLRWFCKTMCPCNNPEGSSGKKGTDMLKCCDTQEHPPRSVLDLLLTDQNKRRRTEEEKGREARGPWHIPLRRKLVLTRRWKLVWMVPERPFEKDSLINKYLFSTIFRIVPGALEG